MWKSRFMDDCFVIINTKNKSDFFLIWIILVFFARTRLQHHRTAYFFLQTVLKIMHIYGIIRFKKGEIRWVSILTEKELKTKHKEDQVLDHSFSTQELGYSNDLHLWKGMKVETGLMFSLLKCNLWTINLPSRLSFCHEGMRVFHILNSIYKLASNLKVVIVKYLVYMDMLLLQCKSIAFLKIYIYIYESPSYEVSILLSFSVLNRKQRNPPQMQCKQ